MKSIGSFFGSIGKGVVHIFNQLIIGNLVPAVDTVAHALGGAVVGFIWPSIQSTIANYFSTPGASLSFVLTPAGFVPLLVGAIVGGVIAAAKHNPNQTIANLAANVTPGQAASAASIIDAKVLALVPPAKAVSKTAGLFLIGFLILCGSANAGVLSYIGVPLNPGIGITEDDLVLGPVDIVGVNLNNTNQVNWGFGLALMDAQVTGISLSQTSVAPNWAIGILGKGYLQNTNPDYVDGTVGAFVAFNPVKLILANNDFPMVAISGERLPDSSIQGFVNLVDLVGAGSQATYRKINR